MCVCVLYMCGGGAGVRGDWDEGPDGKEEWFMVTEEEQMDLSFYYVVSLQLL